MKKAIGFAAAAALVLVAGQANAAVWMSKKGIQQSAAKKAAGDSIDPIRTGRVKAKILKHTFVQKDDGTFDVVTSDVCTKESTFPVYDMRGQDPSSGQMIPVVIECDTTLGGKEATVNIGAMANIVRDTPIDETIDFKGYGVFLNASLKDGGSTGDTFAFQVSGTREIGSGSSLAYLQPNVSYSCSSSSPNPPDSVSGSAKRAKTTKSDCTVSVNEYYSATVDMQD